MEIHLGVIWCKVFRCKDLESDRSIYSETVGVCLARGILGVLLVFRNKGTDSLH